MDEEKRKFKTEFKRLLKSGEGQRALHFMEPKGKSYQQSSEIRELGNKFYLQGKHNGPVHEKILSLYNKSLAFAPNNSEAQATAWANKSALLRHFYKFSECITEINKALKTTKSNALKIKLLCRKAECLTALGSTENQKNLEKAKFTLSKFEDSKKVEDSLKKVVEKTEVTVKNRLLEAPKKNKAKAQKLKMIANVKNMDTSSSVKVNYSKKFGIHLVAARDFKPGEILVVEDPFCSIINATNHACYLYCSHCSRILWTSIPCDQCTWCMFCSEQCKTQAWAEYHDIECQVMSSILSIGLIVTYPYAQLGLRILIKSLREAGNITQLVADLRSITVSTDKNGTISPDAKPEGYKYLYYLLGKANHLEEEDVTIASGITLIALAKNSSIFGSDFDSNNINKLFDIDQALFVGALLVKTCRIINLNNSLSFIKNLDCNSLPVFKFKGQCRAQCCGKDAFIALKSSITINCDPNVARCSTFDNTMITFAVKPIKKGEQLFISIYSPYKYAPLSQRQLVYQKRYGCPCDCQICTENWTEESFSDEVPQESAVHVDRMINETLSIQNRAGPVEDHAIDLLNVTRESVEVFWKHLKLPSIYLISAVTSLIDLFKVIYGEHSEVPDKCIP